MRSASRTPLWSSMNGSTASGTIWPVALGSTSSGAPRALHGKIIIGTPERVAEQLHALQEELGLDGILAELNTGGQIPHDCVLNALRLLCTEVMPRFH